MQQAIQDFLKNIPAPERLFFEWKSCGRDCNIAVYMETKQKGQRRFHSVKTREAGGVERVPETKHVCLFVTEDTEWNAFFSADKRGAVHFPPAS